MGLRGAVMKMIAKILNTRDNLQDAVLGEQAVQNAERIAKRVLEIRMQNIAAQRRSNSESQPNPNR